MRLISRVELFQAQLALFVAIGLQILVWRMNHDLFSGPQYAIIVVELALALVIGFATHIKTLHRRGLHHAAATILLGLMSIANLVALGLIIYSLIASHADLTGLELLSSALAIFVTNIIIFALWYWEIDSPALTRRKWSSSEKDFQFTQQDMPKEFTGWQPQFFDYLYISIINAFNGATVSANPITHLSKFLMAAQASISIFTLALVIARSVSILGS